jgi:hypothetical protein
MRAHEFLTERWTKQTVKNYFDIKKQPEITAQDIKVSNPVPGCVVLKYKTIPDLTRSFFRLAEYYESGRTGRNKQVSLPDFLDQWVDRQGNVDYLKFWDGFNITDRAFRDWAKSARPFSKSEQVMVDVVKQATKGMSKFSIIGVGSTDKDTEKHEMFHAKYYLDDNFRSAADKLLKDNATDPAVKTIEKILRTKLDYKNHVEEEVAAYLYAGSQLKLVFGINPQDLVKKFQQLDKDTALQAAGK